jgi:hypothetical protein
MPHPLHPLAGVQSWVVHTGGRQSPFSAPTGAKTADLSLLGTLGQQALGIGPIAAPLAVLGLWQMWRRHRLLAIAFLTALALSLLTRTKFYLLSPAFVLLFAAGAVAIEHARRGRWLRPVAVILVAAMGVVTLPSAVPLLPPQMAERYLAALGVVQATRQERARLGRLPQHFADRFGWPEMVAPAFPVRK